MTEEDTRKVVEELVNSFKREGKFDQLRKDTVEKVLSNESFSRIAEESNRIADSILKSLSSHVTKDKARITIREQLNVNLRQKIESAVFQVMGTDDNIRLILDQVAIPISAYLGLDDEENSKSKDGSLKNEDHQVCDMEIESDSDKGDVNQEPAAHCDIDCYEDNKELEKQACSDSSRPGEGKCASAEQSEFLNANNTEIPNSKTIAMDEQSLEFSCDGSSLLPGDEKKSKLSSLSEASRVSMEERTRRQRKPRRDPDFAYFS